MLSKIKESKPIFLSISGEFLLSEEKSLFIEAKPAGFILFGRNIKDKAQLTKLVQDLRDIVGWHCPVLVDQEGGRVQRLKPPVWEKWPPAKFYTDLAREVNEETACERLDQDMSILSRELIDVGINVNCSPVADLLFPETHDVIGDRSYGENVGAVSKYSKLVCESFINNNLMPVIKHIPGHGRSELDTHIDLPIVNADLEELDQTDFKVFSNLSQSFKGDGSVWGMMSHVIYESVDSLPASISIKIIRDIVRKNIGFDGLLLTDDISMKALDSFGDLADRSNKALDAGCDMVLYCAGKFDEMEFICNKLHDIKDESVERFSSYIDLNN